MDFFKNKAVIMALILLSISAAFVISKLYKIELFENPEKSIILYYAPWCSHCKALMPEWNKFEEQGVKGYQLKKINADEDKAAVAAANVSGFPTIIKYNNGAKDVYNGVRTAEALSMWAKKN